MDIRQIIDGHIKEIRNENVDLKTERMKICKECPLYLNTLLGPICNPKRWLNLEDKTTWTTHEQIGYKKGCNCRLDAKTRVPGSKCPVGKW